MLQNADRYGSTLASGYTSGGTSLSVTSASGLPGSGVFYLIVQAESTNNEEVFLVTGVSGTTLTVTGAQGNTTASNHSIGAIIIGTILTAGAITQLKADIVPTGGTTGQVLTKNSGTSYDTSWSTPGGSSGTAGGDLSGTYPNPSVATVGGATAANIASTVTEVAAATNADTDSTLVKRDSSGNFSAGTITANLTGNASGTAASITGDLTGDVTSSGMVTTVVKVNGVAITGTPTSGQVPTATSGTAATWQTPSGGGGSNYQTVEIGGTGETQRAKLNLIEGTGVTISAADNSGANSTDVTIAATGSSGYPDLLSEGRSINGGSFGNSWLKNVTLSASGSYTILNLTGTEGYVACLYIALTAAGDTINVLENSTLTITVDGEATPAIDAVRLPLFFGAEYVWNTNDFHSRFIGGQGNASNNAGYYAYIPIPFGSSIEIVINNGSTSSSALLYTEVTYITGVPKSTWTPCRKLYVSSGTLTDQTVNTVCTLVNATGLNPGRLLGVALSIDSYPNSASPATAPLEGAVEIYLDGGVGSPPTANFDSSGTEDFFHMSDYFERESSPTVADYTGLSYASSSTWCAYRFFILDPIQFTNALEVIWNCGNSADVNFTGGVRLAYTIWYYTE